MVKIESKLRRVLADMMAVVTMGWSESVRMAWARI
jgi:hypothetical protein